MAIWGSGQERVNKVTGVGGFGKWTADPPITGWPLYLLSHSGFSAQIFCLWLCSWQLWEAKRHLVWTTFMGEKLECRSTVKLRASSQGPCPTQWYNGVINTDASKICLLVSRSISTNGEHLQLGPIIYRMMSFPIPKHFYKSAEEHLWYLLLHHFPPRQNNHSMSNISSSIFTHETPVNLFIPVQLMISSGCNPTTLLMSLSLGNQMPCELCHTISPLAPLTNLDYMKSPPLTVSGEVRIEW